MRTVAHKRVVAFKTFLRTLLHEICHHLDYTHLRLADSYHTQGFFKRESSLIYQLVPRPSCRRLDRPRHQSGRSRRPRGPRAHLANRARPWDKAVPSSNG